VSKRWKPSQEAAKTPPSTFKEVGVNYAVLNEEVVVNRGLYDNVLRRNE